MIFWYFLVTDFTGQGKLLNKAMQGIFYYLKSFPWIFIDIDGCEKKNYF